MFMFHVEHRVGDKMNKKKMMLALNEAKKAYKFDEIPVGCVIFKGNEIIACGYNKKESQSNAILHAEMIAIEKACKKLKSWRLDDCVMFVTLEPCMMCMGAILESRIKTVYYGTKSKNEQMYDVDKLSKNIKLFNLNDNECSKILSDFFKNRRKK